MSQRHPTIARLTSDLCEVALGVGTRRELHDAWLDVLAPLGYDKAMVLDDTVEPGPFATLGSRNVSSIRFEDARRDARRYLEDYPILRRRAAMTRDVIELTPKDTWLRVYADHGVPYGERAVLGIALRGRGRSLCVVTLTRATPTSTRFSDRGKAMAMALAPIMALGDLVWAQEPDRDPVAFADLTARQHDVARLVARGLTNREIARVLGSAENTVRNQVAAVFRRLHVSTRAELAGLR